MIAAIAPCDFTIRISRTEEIRDRRYQDSRTGTSASPRGSNCDFEA